jgi:8-oxo-dGTP pyrophosphatase MutT (NUDIX family)
MRSEIPHEDSNEWYVSVTVAILLEIRDPKEDDRRLLLVRDRETQKWGVIAGHVAQGESLKQSLKREICEETGLKSGSIQAGAQRSFNLILIPKGKNTSLGIFFYGSYHQGNLEIDSNGWEVKGDPDIDFTKPFTRLGVLDLIENYEDMVHRPEFNLTQLARWLVEKYRPATQGKPHTQHEEEIAKRFDKLIEEGRVPYLEWRRGRGDGMKERPTLGFGEQYLDMGPYYMDLNSDTD